MELFFLGEDLYPAVRPADEVESLVWTRRYFGCGNFTMKLAPGAEFDAGAVKFIYKPDSGECACVERVRWSDGAFTVSGRMIESLLDRRIIHGSGYMTGRIETMVRNIVRLNAVSSRVIPNLTLSSEVGFPDTGELVYGWEGLSDWVYSSLRPYGMSYRITPAAEGNRLSFSVVRGQDRTAEQTERSAAVFSDETASILSAEYERYDGEHRNVAFVRSGDGRLELCGDAEHVGFGRRELYVSARDTVFGDGDTESSFAAELQARGRTALERYPAAETVRGVAAADGVLRYREDYDLGDLCEVILKRAGVSAKVRITSVDEVYEGGSMTAYPSFGNEEEGLRSFVRRELGRVM